jgi:hypothetical protein
MGINARGDFVIFYHTTFPSIARTVLAIIFQLIKILYNISMTVIAITTKKKNRGNGTERGMDKITKSLAFRAHRV